MLGFLLGVVIVSTSGVLAPGPLFFGTVVKGTKRGLTAGLEIALGHMAFELPFSLLLALGLLSIVQGGGMRLIDTIGGAGLLTFGILTLRSIRNTKRGLWDYGRPFVLGLALTGLNPFFIVWWLTIGSKLIADALLIASLTGFAIMYLTHIWMDFAWLGLISHLSKKGMDVMGGSWYRYAMIAFSLVLILWGLLAITGF